MKPTHLRRLLVFALTLAILGITAVLLTSTHVCKLGRSRILTAEAASDLPDTDCILVLGCLVHDSGNPSAMLRDRLNTSIGLYETAAAPKLLMSGDHGHANYNEVGAMKQYALDAGVPSEDIFMDHAGFSTYESLYRARDIFEAKKIIIVTQEYHLYRALYIADALGLEAYGVAADRLTYAGQAYRDAREILARAKDVVSARFQPQPTFLGDVIPISGSGDQTND